MKKIVKKTAAVVLTGLMTVGMLTGCGEEKELDGAAVVATVNGEEIPMGVLSLRARQVQAQVTAMYISFLGSAENIWNQEVDSESGETYGEQTVNDCLEQTELMYIMRSKAAEYGVEVTDADQEAIAAAASQFMADNDEETIKALAVTEDQVKTYLELETYTQRMYNPIIASVDTEVSDEEAQQSSFTYLSVATTDMEEDAAAEEKEKLQGILDQVLADEAADWNTIASEVDETYSVLSGTFATNAWEEEASYPAEVLTILSEMEDGEVYSEIIETEEDGIYIVRMDAVFDEEATETEKSNIIMEREEALYAETTEQWLADADITVDEKVLKTLTIKDNHIFSYKEEEVAEEEIMEEELIVEEEIESGDEEVIIEDEILEEEVVEEEVSGEEAADEEAETEEIIELTDEEMAELDELIEE